MKHRLTIYLFYRSLLTGKKEVLLLRRTADSQRFPGFEEVVGGRVNEGEDPRAAAYRELREETGLSSFLLRLRHFKDYPYGDGNTNHVYYLVLWTKPRININKNPDHEHDGATWKPLHEVGQLAYKHREILCELLDALHWSTMAI